MILKWLVADLESRKRAPLYQKKQEEELKAAIEKAQDCEIRAQDAEIKQKETKVIYLQQLELLALETMTTNYVITNILL